MPLNLPVEFAEAVQRQGVRFKVQGLLGEQERVYTLGTAPRELSALFELYCQPLIVDIADRLGLRIADAPRTVYPSFTLMKNEADRAKVAIDIKTTFRRPELTFPLGPYTAFSRNGAQDTRYPLDQYAEHWVIVFVYRRDDDIEWFVQERYRLTDAVPTQDSPRLPAPTRR
ncbi:endonuclease/exonuclease/phosphatase [Myxococcus stipitatus DSM 14675]|uniref:Endonuclease/exonuclease/phosphatase n=1 Tax=Myxococcus stipitatus (strain DSM 14675 / JCM 12634 / Mx s8) TaxID=1278073 RepID=L7UJD8_MYXSD|nr:type II restriction endonuclease [Myxococcus stipitatus]AGC48128.1 endonuclease/exonuclease/phosphatase [Myxococcus stipitatus DSM 14675]